MHLLKGLRTPSWALFLAVGMAGIVGYFLIDSALSEAVIYDGLNLAAVLAILRVMASLDRGDRGHWGFIAAGAVMSLAGNISWDVHELVLKNEPFPSVADAFYLAQYPLLATGFLMMVRRRTGRRDRIALVDSLIVASSAAAIAWLFLVVPVTEDASLGTLGQVFAGAYPLMDVILLATVTRLLVVPGRHPTSYLLLLASLLTLLVGDVAFGILAPLDLYETGSLIDAAWMASFVLLGAAALHPSPSLSPEQRPVAARRDRSRRQFLVLAAALLGPGALVLQHVMGRSSLPVILIGSGTIVVLILMRVAEQQRTEDALRWALRDVTKLNREREALVTKLVTAQEEERKLIAREIHDDPIQKMVAVRMRLDMLLRYEPGLMNNEDFGKVVEGAETSVKSLRHLMFELRPYHLDTDGLAAALGLYLEEQRALVGDTRLELEDEMSCEPGDEGRTVLYRIAQEAVTNAKKHARASCIRLELADREQGHLLRIVDDGVGFDAKGGSESAPGHLGLTSMRERAEMVGGRISLQSRPGEGTTVIAWVPRGSSSLAPSDASPGLEREDPHHPPDPVGASGPGTLGHPIRSG
jgi:signal transduction histidine kinase